MRRHFPSEERRHPDHRRRNRRLDHRDQVPVRLDRHPAHHLAEVHPYRGGRRG